MNKLSKRLQTIYDLVLPCKTLLEIGCDHCWLSIFLVKEGKVEKAIASDINNEPLESCKANIKNTGNLNIITKLSDGFDDIKETFDSVVIAGIGGKLMCEILNKNQYLKNKQLILQPQKNEFYVRKWLKKNNFKILKESLIEDNSFTYVIISVHETGIAIKNDLDIYIGPKLKHNKSDIHLKKCQQRLNHLTQFVNNIKEKEKMIELKKEITILKTFIN